MNWFRKLFGINDEENNEEYEVKEQEQIAPNNQAKTPFRFPLISDVEKNLLGNEQPNEEKIINEPSIEKTPKVEQEYKPLYMQEMWQQRKQQTTGQQSVQKEVDDTPAILRKKRSFASTEVPSPIYGFSKKHEKPKKVEEPINIEAPIRNFQETWQQRKRQTVDRSLENKIDVNYTPTIEKKKGPFTPTEVPSPVYGFSKRRELQNIQEEQKEKDVKIEKTRLEDAPNTEIQDSIVIEEAASTILEEKEITPVLEQAPEIQTVVPKENIQPVTVLELKSDNEIRIENEVKMEEPVVDKDQILENPELTLKEGTSTTLLEQNEITPELEQAPEIQTVATKENIRPFNVLMLKSDKEKSREKEVRAENPVMEEARFTEIPQSMDKEEESSTLLEDIEISSEMEQAIEDKLVAPQEKIRPFNVLMLKSDKEKRREKEMEAVDPVMEEARITEIPQSIVNEEEVSTLLEDKEISSEMEQATSDKPVAPTEKIRPFNVLMLKSDMEKLNKLTSNNKQPLIKETSVPVETPHSQVEDQGEQTEQEIIPSTYTKPSFDYLLPPEMKDDDKEWMEDQAFTLVEALSHFQVTGEIVQMVQGPAVTQFELTVGHGTKVSKIRNLADDLKLALAAKDIRIQAPIPGKRSIGIEIPNRTSRAVRLSEVIDSDVFVHSDSPLESALGLDLTGKPVTLDLRKMPHGLIAGATGSGKSVFINSLLVSLLYKATPDEVKLLLIDPKMVELAPFNHIPHLVSPVITDVKAATASLKWAVEEMERRYQLFAHIGVRDISRYNTLATEKRQFAQKLPYIVIVIDELADLMMMAPAEVEDAICRIAQKARACGIHLVLATQRPSVDVITGLIKANIPTRIAFSVSSQIDSRTILDQQGAERLLGKGDMLYQGNGMSSPVRIQGTYVSDEEIESVIEYARGQGTPDYLFVQEELLQKAEIASEQDELFEEACRFIVEQGSASTSLLQRKFHLGYNRAARLIDAMYENGYITEQKGSKARDVLLTNDSLEQIFS